MKRILKIIVPSVLMLVLVYLMRGGKDILDGIYIVFPIMYILIGIICSYPIKELLICLILTSVAFIIPINILYYQSVNYNCEIYAKYFYWFSGFWLLLLINLRTRNFAPIFSTIILHFSISSWDKVSSTTENITFGILPTHLFPNSNIAL